MCIICVSPRFVSLPSEDTIRTMFENNPDGAGFMFARNGRVEIHKGFMVIEDLLRALKSVRLTEKDSVVYHFRISTQAGVNPEMTHPFPLSSHRADMKVLDLLCRFGIAHNGVIRSCTTPFNDGYSDTALFITNHLSSMIRRNEDLRNPKLLNLLEILTGSRLAIMDGTGYVATVGQFLNRDGILYSNSSFEAPKSQRFRQPKYVQEAFPWY